MNRDGGIRRIWLAGLGAALIGGIFLARLAYFQLVKGEEYHARAWGNLEYTFTLDPVRGRILDSRGLVLASTRTVYDLNINRLLVQEGEENKQLYQALSLLEEAGQSWEDPLPLTLWEEGEEYAFLDQGEGEGALKEALGLQQYATPDQVMARLVERYDLEGYAPRWQRLLAGVRRQMELEGYEEYQVFTLARELNRTALAAFREEGVLGRGLELSPRTLRTYPSKDLASSILGTVGAITREDWTAGDYRLASLGYGMDESIGRSGVEALCQETLRGTPGTRTISLDREGNLVSDEVTQEPQPGLSTVLTLDSKFQEAVNQMLEEQILTLQKTKARGKGREANAGAVVVLDLETGGILAAANYPTYDLEQYTALYSQYLTQKGDPLFDRALQGQYAPGSAFKPCVALAGLLTGTTDPNQRVNCTGTYTFYGDYQPGCLQISHGGPISMVNALKYSCNIYFYDLGRRLGVDQESEYAQALGLGTDTGLELPQGEGSLTWETDSNYSKGLVLQASIGQGNNAFTPVQLATYAATLAGHGSRYPTHILAGYYDESTGSYEPDPLPEKVEALSGEDAFQTVEKGMTQMATTLSALRQLPFSIACKTGSPQRPEMYGSEYYTNTVMIAYGPVPDPKIAVAVVIEYGGGGSNGAPLMADIFRWWSENRA